MLLLEQESHLLYENLDYKKWGYKIYTKILKNHIQKTLDVNIDENQSAAIKTILHTFSTIRDVIDVSHKLNSNLARLVFSQFFSIHGNLRNLKEKPTRKTCFSREMKRLALRIYLSKFS